MKISKKLHALSALEIGLWDIKEKALGIPVNHLLGGVTRSIIVYGLPVQTECFYDNVKKR
ncbi:hypothetical protein [Dyadobacter sp. 3J3]|uniref:hypothetical protein n=1 Tax=Dyadobacter sp. 3J3 TaxID=2606600 RepID=UPI001E35E5FA|nr:hypothetical protein [Dyadobacter sp. 3J3]